MNLSAKLILIAALMLPLSAADFSIEIGNPVAAGSPGQPTVQKKGGILAVRSQGCSDPAKVHFDATAASLDAGIRLSAPLSLSPGTVAGAYTVATGYSLIGKSWVMVLSADCAGSKAGGLIPIDKFGGYNREASKFFSHAPTTKEIDEALGTPSTDSQKGKAK
jgi:hypothetical protein